MISHLPLYESLANKVQMYVVSKSLTFQNLLKYLLRIKVFILLYLYFHIYTKKDDVCFLEQGAF